MDRGIFEDDGASSVGRLSWPGTELRGEEGRSGVWRLRSREEFLPDASELTATPGYDQGDQDQGGSRAGRDPESPARMFPAPRWRGNGAWVAVLRNGSAVCSLVAQLSLIICC